MVTITLPDNYGPVLGVALGAIPLLGFIHGMITGRLRKPAKVPYPHCYATKEECKANPKAEQFNCAQRAHTNYIENASQTMLTALVAGLKYPELAACIAVSWLVFRVVFLYGYVFSGKAQGKGRLMGSFFWLAQGGLWLLTLGVAKDLTNFNL